MRNRIPCQRDAGTRLATALRRRPFSACNKGNRRRLHAGNFFTRATTKVVYLLVVTDLSVQTFVLAYRGFAARRSVPQQTISDNASTYLLAAEEVTALFPSQILKASLSKQGVDWRFIPKGAPYHGGFRETLIGVTTQGFSGIIYNTGWRTYPDCLRCSLQVMKE